MESIREYLTAVCSAAALFFLVPSALTAQLHSVASHALSAGSVAEIQNSALMVSVAADGSYSIGPLGRRAGAGPLLRAQVAAEVDNRWIVSSQYPKHQVAQAAFNGELGSGQELRVTHAGLSGQPDLICSLRLYQQQAYGEISLQVRNTSRSPITVQAVREIQAVNTPIINFGGPEAEDRVLSDSYSEDRPALRILDLAAAENGMHRAVGSQLIYNRQSGESLFLGALTSRRLLTIFHLRVQPAGPHSGANAHIVSYDVDSTGTTEILKGESLKESPPEDRIVLSIPVAEDGRISSERMMFAAGNDYHAQLEAYGNAIRVLHKARVSAPTPIGWWSWTAYYFGLNQGTAMANAQWLAEHLKSLGYVYFHIDEGYQYARGEYMTPDAALFPHGMGYIGNKVRSLGLTFGVWTAPFEVSERSSVLQNHKDWLVHNVAGQPIPIGHVTENNDQLYVLDTTNPGAQDWLRKTYSTLVNDWGVRYIKMDFMDDSAIEGYYHRPNTTALEAQRIGLEIIRQTVGEDVLLDKDGSPMLNPVGVVDAGRTSVDTGHTFVASKEAAPGIAARYYMNRNFYIADPDAFTVSRQIISEQPWHGGVRPLTLDEAQVSIALSAVSGGMYEIGDDLPTLGQDADRMALAETRELLNMARLGQAAVPVDLMSYRPEDEMPSVFLLREDQRQSILAVFNWTEQPRSHKLQFTELKLPSGGRYQAFDVLDQNKPVTLSNGAVELNNQASHSVRMIKIVDNAISANPPRVSGTVPQNAKAGALLTFSAEADAHGVPATGYHWDFGDGTKEDGAAVQHAYTTAGDKTVRLNVAGVDGVPAEKTFAVSVTGNIDTQFRPGEKRRWSPQP